MCASDPDSYDGLVCRAEKVAVVDGTSPHVMEPHYYGALEEIINMGEVIDTDKLRLNVDEIRNLCDKNASSYRKCTNYINAASILMRNSKRIQAEYIDYEKLYNYVIRFAKRDLHSDKTTGEVHYRFLTAITNKGEVTFLDEIPYGYSRIIGIDDPVGSVGGQLLDCLLSVALDCGINAIAGVSPYDTEELLQLFFPDDGVAIVREPSAMPISRTVHASRFLNMKAMQTHKCKIAFNKKVSGENLCRSYLL